MSQIEFENNGDSKEYKVKAIHDNKIYAKELNSGHHLLSLYYLVLWISYYREENIWESTSAI